MAETAGPAASRVRQLAGAAALAGGLCWTVKAAVILAGGGQPDYLFELAPAAQGSALALLGFLASPGPSPRLAGVVAAALGIGAAVSYLTLGGHVLFHLLFLLANLAVVAGAYVVGRHVRRHHILGKRSGVLRGIGVWTVPAVLAGGLLSQGAERLLEVPILMLGLAWALVGLLCLAPAARKARAAKPRGARAKPSGARAAGG